MRVGTLSVACILVLTVSWPSASSAQKIIEEPPHPYPKPEPHSGSTRPHWWEYYQNKYKHQSWLDTPSLPTPSFPQLPCWKPETDEQLRRCQQQQFQLQPQKRQPGMQEGILATPNPVQEHMQLMQRIMEDKEKKEGHLLDKIDEDVKQGHSIGPDCRELESISPVASISVPACKSSLLMDHLQIPKDWFIHTPSHKEPLNAQ